VTASISQVRKGLEFRLKSITGLHAYPVWPDTVLTPAAIVKPMTGLFHQAMGSPGHAELTMEITFLAAASGKGLANGQKILDDYLDVEGPKSIKKAIESDITLGGIATTLIVTGWSGYGSMVVGEIEYLGAQLQVDVWP
jgi:hypothetical protein